MLYFITGNANKFAEVQAIIPEIAQLAIDLPEIQEFDAQAIIRAKLAAAYEHQSGEFIVEDTSLYCDGLGGLPGPLIKWFLQQLQPAGLAELVLTTGNTHAYARTIIGYAKSRDEIHFFEGAVSGTIVAPSAESKFGWDPIFLPDGQTMTFAQMTREQKNEISHRRIAVNKLREFLSSAS